MTNEATDIVILGGGIAGYAAAMAASENKRVALIDKNSVLGGATTLTNVGTLCGLYYRSSVESIVPHPFCRSFVEALKRYDDQARIVSLEQGIHVMSYEWSNLQRLLSEHLASKNVRLLLEAEVLAADAEKDRIRSITYRKSGKTVVLNCEQVIDCSGTGYIAQSLHHEMLTSESYQSAAQVIRFHHVKATSEYALNLALKKVILKNSASYHWPISYASLSVIPGSLRNNKVDLKLPLSNTITDRIQPDDLAKEVEHHLPGILSAIAQVESLAEAEVERIFPTPGIRSQQRPKGQYILTEQDILTCRKAADGIAIGTWPIEEWDSYGKVKLDYFAMDDAYTISAGCLMSSSFKNLFFAGKGISAESKAIASARVTGICLQTGYAAGKIAACESDQERKKVIQEIHSQISA